MRKLNAELGQITLISGDRQTGKTTAVLEILEDIPPGVEICWFDVVGHSWVWCQEKFKYHKWSCYAGNNIDRIYNTIRSLTFNPQKTLFVIDNADLIPGVQSWKTELRAFQTFFGPQNALIMTASDPDFGEWVIDEVGVFYNLTKDSWQYCFGGGLYMPEWLNNCDNKFWQELRAKVV